MSLFIEGTLHTKRFQVGSGNRWWVVACCFELMAGRCLALSLFIAGHELNVQWMGALLMRILKLILLHIHSYYCF